MEKKGIALLAIGNGTYAHWAVNMAMSIKYYNEDIPVQLIYEPKTMEFIAPYETQFFDVFTEMRPEHIYHDGKFSAGFAKLNLYTYFEYKHTIYLDVDGIVIQDIDSLFTKCIKNFHTQTKGKFTHESEDWTCNWMGFKEAVETYGLKDEYTGYDINSSFQSIKKNRTTYDFYYRAKKNFLPDYKSKVWGNSFPDELAFNIATAQNSINPCFDNEWSLGVRNFTPVYFRLYNMLGSPESLDKIKQTSWVIGFHGDRGYNHKSSYVFYDKLAAIYNKKMLGRHNPYKTHLLMKSKYVTRAIKKMIK